MNIESFLNDDLWQEDCVGVAQTAIMLAHAFSKQNKFVGPLQKNCVILITKDYFYELTKVSEKKEIFDYLLKKGVSFVDVLIEEWKGKYKKLEEYTADFANLSDSEIKKWYADFFEYATTLWSYPILCESGDYFSTHELIKKVQKECIVDEKEATHIAITLTSSSEMSFLDAEHLDALRIISMNEKNISGALERHVRKYYWMKTNYLKTTPFTKEDILSQRRELTKEEIEQKIATLENYEKEIKERKKQVLNQYPLSKQLKEEVDMLARFAWWVDERKVMMLKIFSLLFSCLDEINKRYLHAENLMRYYAPQEVIELLTVKEKVEEKVLKSRKEGCIYAIDENQRVTLVREAKQMISQYLKPKVTSLKGMIASPFAEPLIGKVGIIRDAHTEEFEKGRILVASMTRPEFLPHVRKAKAIVTDEGGISCHAAIVAREMKIPCIIGTKNATRVLSSKDQIVLNPDGSIELKP